MIYQSTTDGIEPFLDQNVNDLWLRNRVSKLWQSVCGVSHGSKSAVTDEFECEQILNYHTECSSTPITKNKKKCLNMVNDDN